MYKRIFFFALTLFVSSGAVQGQDLKYGLRAGINMSTIFGPSELGPEGEALENHRLTTKIAFGATLRYPINKSIGLATELSFVQRGSNYSYEGTGYIRLPDYQNQGEIFFEGHNKNILINNSNSYLEVPILFYATLIPERLQFEFGPSVGFLIISRGLGTLKYTDPNSPSNLIEMDMNHRYLSDQPGETADIPNGFGGFIAAGDRTGRVDGTTVTFPQSIGAYYFEDEKQGNVFNTVDLGLNAGFAFFFTPGVRVGLRAYYGFLDVTNSRYHYEQQRLAADRSYIRRDVQDRNFGIQLYLGLQFN